VSDEWGMQTEQEVSAEEENARLLSQKKALDDARKDLIHEKEQVGAWFAQIIVADELCTGLLSPVPRCLREPIAKELVRDQEHLGWPDMETAFAYIDELYEWTQ